MKAEWTNSYSLTKSQTTKAILVIEMSDKQWEHLHSADVLLMNSFGVTTVYPCVSIKPMPQEQDIYEIGMDEEDTNAKRQWNKGWNACIDEIIGETE